MSTETEYTTKQAAEILGVSAIRVRQFCQEGRLGRKHGRDYLITEKDLQEFREIPRKSGPRRENFQKD